MILQTGSNTLSSQIDKGINSLPVPSYRSVIEHPITWCILVISCIPYIILNKQSLGAISLWFMPSSLTELVQPFSIWRLWSPTFVHYTLTHLLTNLYLWWLFASKIESVSRLQLIVVTLISVPIGNLCQWWIAGPKFGGLSGLAYALMSYLWVIERYDDKPRYHVETTLNILMLALIPICATGLFGKFANYAHLGGLVSGALLAFTYLAINRRAASTIKPDSDG